MRIFPDAMMREIFAFPYYLLALSIASMFWIIYSILDQRIFFAPYFVFYVPEDGVVNLVLSSILSIMLGLVITMNMYNILNALGTRKQLNRDLSLSVLPGTISILSSTCAGCSVVMSTLIISTFGVVGINVFSVLTTYDADIRLISLGLLIYLIYCVHKNIRKGKICNRRYVPESRHSE